MYKGPSASWTWKTHPEDQGWEQGTGLLYIRRHRAQGQRKDAEDGKNDEKTCRLFIGSSKMIALPNRPIDLPTESYNIHNLLPS